VIGNIPRLYLKLTTISKPEIAGKIGFLNEVLKQEVEAKIRQLL
jgi:hypothetical protein